MYACWPKIHNPSIHISVYTLLGYMVSSQCTLSAFARRTCVCVAVCICRESHVLCYSSLIDVQMCVHKFIICASRRKNEPGKHHKHTGTYRTHGISHRIRNSNNHVAGWKTKKLVVVFRFDVIKRREKKKHIIGTFMCCVCVWVCLRERERTRKNEIRAANDNEYVATTGVFSCVICMWFLLAPNDILKDYSALITATSRVETTSKKDITRVFCPWINCLIRKKKNQNTNQSIQNHYFRSQHRCGLPMNYYETLTQFNTLWLTYWRFEMVRICSPRSGHFAKFVPKPNITVHSTETTKQ